jgi:hypothetical protein
VRLKPPPRARCFRNPTFKNFDDMELMAVYRTQKLEHRPFFPPPKPAFNEEDDSFSGDEFGDDDSLTPREYLCLEDRMAARGYHWIEGKLVHVPQGDHSPSESPPPLPSYSIDNYLEDSDSPQSPMDSPLY